MRKRKPDSGNFSSQRPKTQRARLEEQYHNENALRRSEERLKLAQIAAGAGIWDWDIITGETEWTQELYNLFGLDPAITSSSFSSWEKIIFPEDKEIAGDRIKYAIKHKKPLDSEYRIIHSSGELRWIKALGNTIYDAQGKPVRMLGICLDITSQKEKENKLQQLTSAIQRERDHFAALVNSITDEIWFADKDRKITLINPAVLKEFGVISGDEPEIEKVVENLEVYRPDGSLRPLSETPLLRARAGEIILNEDEIIRSPTSGELRHRQVNASPVRDKDGSIIGSVAVVRDITGRKRNEDIIVYNEKRNRVLSEIASELLKGRNNQTGIENICHIAMNFLHCQVFFNFLLEPETNRLHLNAFNGISIDEAKKIEWLDFGVAVCGCVARDGVPIIAENIQDSEDDLTEIVKSYGVRAYCSHPLKAEGKIIGTLSFGTTDRDQWTESEISLMESVSGLMSVAIQRKSLEEELIKSRENLERAQRIGKLGNWRLNFKKRELVWSDETYHIFGVPPGTQLTFDTFLSIVHPEDLEYLRSKWEGANLTKNFDIEHRVIANGKIKWVREKAFLEFDENGQLISGFGITQDITKRKNAEIDLTGAKTRLDMALKNANIGLWEYNVKTNEALMDERSEKMFGLKHGSFGGTMEAFEKVIHEEDINHVRRSISNALQNNLPYETIFRTRPVNGKSRYISAKALVIRDKNNEILTLSGVNFDITELKEGTESLISKLNMDLLRSNNDLQQFAYVASHDLQEPLRMVSSFTQLLQKQYADRLDQNANEYINFAVDGSKRMYELINGLLAYSRVQTRGQKFNRVSMDSVLAKVLDNLKLLISDAKALVTSDSLPEITADENQMIQLLQNLIENSIKFTRGLPYIHISSFREGQMVIFSVKDKGIGIRKEYYEKIFRIFQKLHSPQEYKGTGIGLAICKRIVERHGGQIWVESVADEGSEFLFSIPEEAAEHT